MKESQSTQAAGLRRRAEERLKGQQTGAAPPLQEADVQRLVYELQVQQMELDLQGEELRQARTEIEAEVLAQDLTEQKRSEEALQESEARYRALFEESIDGVFITSAAGKILDISRAGIAMFGYDTKEEMLRLDLATEVYADPNDRARVLSAVRERGATEYEVRVKKKDGEILLTRCFNTVVRDSNGEIICYRGVIRDITEIRRAEEELRRSERRKAILNRIANVFLMVPDEEMYGEVLAVVLETMESKFGVFGYIAENGDLVMPSMTREIWSECQVPGKSIVFPSATWGESLWGRAIREKKAFHSNGPFHTPEGHIHIDCFLTAPIVFGNDTIGLLSVANNERGYGEEDKGLLESIADYVSPILNARLQRDRQERERKQAEETLRQSEARFRQTLDNMLEGCMLIGFDWTYLYVNESAARHGHGKRENLIGRTMLEMYPGVQDTVIFAHYRRCMEERIPQRFEAPFTFPDGSTDWFEFSVEPTPDGIFVLSLDISERKRAEARILHLTRLYATLSQVNQTVVRVKQKEELFEKISNVAVEVGQFRLAWIGINDEASGQLKPVTHAGDEEGYRQYVGNNVKSRFDDAMDSALRTGKVVTQQAFQGDHDSFAAIPFGVKGKVIGVLNLYATETTFSDQEELMLLYEISADVSFALDAMETERERKHAEEALRESEQKFRSFVEESSEGFTLADEQGTIIECNRALEKMTGLSAKQVIGRALWAVQYEMLLPELRTSERYERAKQVVLDALQTGQSPLFSNVIEIEMMKQDGNLQFVQQTVFPIRTDKGYRIGSVTRDITQRKRAEQKVNQLAAIVQSSEDAIIGKTLDGIITSWNQGAEKTYGYAESEVIGKPISILVLPGCEDEVSQILEQIKSGEYIEHYEAARRRKDGREIQMSLTISPVRDAEGRIVAASTIGRDITERKRAEEALWQTNELLERVFANVDFMIACMDVNFTFIRVNRAYAEADHRAPEFFVGKNHFELYPNEENENIFRRVIQTGEPYFAYAKPFVYAEHPERGVTYWNWTVQPMKEVDGSIGGLVLSLLNVTERERAARELRAASLYARSLIEASLDPLVTISPEGKITDVNRATEQVTGVSRERLISDDFSDYFTEPERARAGYQEVFREGSVRDYPLEIQHRDGHVTPVLYNASVYRDEEGHVVGVFAAARDITERKRMEAEREQLLTQIQTQAHQIAQIIDTVPEGVLLLDAAGQVLLANPIAGRDLITLAQAQVGDRLTHLGDRPLAELLTSPPKGLWHEVLADRRSFEVIARPIANGPEPERWVLVINDVTQAHAVREQLQQQERLAAVGQLAAGIAHDFNNILAIIALHTPLVARASGLTERDRERLAIISEQTGHATRLIQQILDFSRRAVLERRPLDLGPLLQEQVKLLARTLPETIEVCLACESGEHVVLADPTRLQQMLMNLAVNARDTMPAGGTLRLALARQEMAPRPDLPAGPWIRLTVADSGTGIAPEALAHLFEPFFTTKPHGQGTGLGLAQVHGIVKQHEGEIEVHSEVGQGATFTIYLPAVAEAAAVPAPAAVAPQLGAEQMILIVEDNAVLLDAISDIVETLGYRVVGAGNGEEALAVLETRGDAIALVLSDLMMPVMGGEALLAAIQARGLTTPVVMLSGYPLEGELARLKAQGLAGWLLKPPVPDDLARLLAQALAD